MPLVWRMRCCDPTPLSIGTVESEHPRATDIFRVSYRLFTRLINPIVEETKLFEIGSMNASRITSLSCFFFGITRPSSTPRVRVRKSPSIDKASSSGGRAVCLELGRYALFPLSFTLWKMCTCLRQAPWHSRHSGGSKPSFTVSTMVVDVACRIMEYLQYTETLTFISCCRFTV